MPMIARGQVTRVEHKVSPADAEKPYDYQRVTLDDGRGIMSVRLNPDCEVPEVNQMVAFEVAVRPYKDSFDGQLKVAYRGLQLVEQELSRPARVA